MIRDHKRLIERFFFIENKQRKTVQFMFNLAQVDYTLKQTLKDILLKARQLGFSSKILAEWLIECLTVKNTNAVVISHEKSATQRLLAKVRFFIQKLKEQEIPELVPRIQYESKSEIYFPEQNSRYYIGTAGQRTFGRGDTIHRIHCSEMAYWPNAEKLMSGILEAVPERIGRIVIESTANGMGGDGEYFYRLCEESKKRENDFKLHFYPWWWDLDYKLDIRSEGELTQEEKNLMARYNLTDYQIAWRRMKKKQQRDKFSQEYPEDSETCFLQSGRPVFSGKIKLKGKPEEPIAKEEYVIGADPAEGLATGDDSAAKVFKKSTWRQVAGIRGKWDPRTFAVKLDQLGRKYNFALIGVERNNHGHAVLLKLRELEYPRIYVHWDKKYGWITDSKTKYILLDELGEALEEDLVGFYEEDILADVRACQYDDKGNVDTQGKDGLMAMGIAWQMRKVVSPGIEWI
ncbi:MAG: hypothetical protein ACKKMS_00060 [Candidatus Nealsonbacteria bacterium]